MRASVFTSPLDSSELRLARLSHIAGYPFLELDPEGFLGQDKPENTDPIRRNACQQIHNELRIAVSIERALHEEQDKSHGDAKQHRVIIGLHNKFADWNAKLAAHVAGQKEQ